MKSRNTYFEFSKIYKRVMDIELSLKTSFFNASSTVSQNTKFLRLIPYITSSTFSVFFQKYNYTKIQPNGTKKSRNKLKDIINSKDTDEVKFAKFLRIVYLSDLLNIITNYKILYKDKRFCKVLYLRKESLNDLKSYASKLISLRNVIMHFNIKDYYLQKDIFLETLNFWERILDCNNNFIHNIPDIEPTINNILEQIQIFQPDLLDEQDRVLVDTFDDIAFIKGLTPDKFPQYWSIIRQLYNLKSKL